MEYKFIIKNQIGIRLDICLSIECEKIFGDKNFSRAQIKKIITCGRVLVNNCKSKASYITKRDDYININLKDLDNKLKLKPEEINLNVCYEDQDIIIINKSQGMIVHPGAGNFTGTLVNGLMFYYNKNLSDLNGDMRPGIIHRIDKDTSGIIVIAKNNYAHKFLAAQFESHTIEREYLAIVKKNLYTNGIIDRPIARNKFDRKKMCVTQNGKRAITCYKLIKNLDGYAFISLKLKTGRTHQIRVHMASIGHYILGDKVYGAQDNKFNLKGQMLHAKTLGFIHPSDKKYIKFEQEAPEYFKIMLEKLNQNRS